MDKFDEVIRCLDAQFPEQFEHQVGMKGFAVGLVVRCRSREGHAFVYEPHEDRYLLGLHETDDSDNPEIRAVLGVEEVVQRIRPWAFPAPWTAPEPLDMGQERRRLEKIACGLRARGDIRYRLEEPSGTLTGLLTPEGRDQLTQDLADLRPERIIAHFPWDASGRLALRTTVVLSDYEMSHEPKRYHSRCLLAIGPEKRRDEQRIRIELGDVILVNQDHRWKNQPWMWKEAPPPSSLRWGAPHEAGERTPESEQAARAVQWLDEGRIEEALELYGVHLTEDLHKLLGGERIPPPACCAHPDEKWRSRLVDMLRQSAPWLFRQAVTEEAARIRAWVHRKVGRGMRLPKLKLAIFPGQRHSRKASLMLVGDTDGRLPHLEIEATGSNARAHDTAWKRPIAVDLLRAGIEPPPMLLGEE